ncbi:MAG TPA: thioesterase family protein [Thermohalobaculum sp.]|nr:thioesterase family protein [Thermohalobaculum sp.]
MRKTDEFEPKPIRTTTRRVPPEWIDYNGHMNVAYYTLAFDKAMDELLERLGVGESFVREANMGPMALATQIHYLAELVEGAEFACDVQLLDADAKRVHCFLTMIRLADAAEAATYETLTMNVDLARRRSAPYPDWAQQRIGRLLAAHARLPRPSLAGARIGIRRKGA